MEKKSCRSNCCLSESVKRPQDAKVWYLAKSASLTNSLHLHCCIPDSRVARVSSSLLSSCSQILTNSLRDVPGMSRECDSRFVIGLSPTDASENFRSRPGRRTFTFRPSAVSVPSRRWPTEPYSSLRSKTTA